MPQKYDPLRHNITVQTWGTKDQVSNGIDNFVDQELFGGNVGHASITMTLPINEETKMLLARYCYKPSFDEYKATSPNPEEVTYQQFLDEAAPVQIIPAHLKTHTTYISRLDAEGKQQKTDKIASQVEYMQIEFSWWPSTNDTFFLSTIEKDMRNERPGKHFEYSEEAKAFLQPEMRRHGGQLGSKLMTYAPSQIFHASGASDEVIKKVELNYKLDKVKETLALEDSINSKINMMKTATVENTTLELIFKNIKLDFEKITQDYLEQYPTDPQKENIKQFKKFVTKKVHYFMLERLEEGKQILDELAGLSNVEIDKESLIIGVRPDHTVTLPLQDEDSRGLSPEAMLRAIRQLTDTKNAKFNLHTMNCSKTTTAVLSAGAAHDPLLQEALSEQAFGFFGTPQQVLGNAQRAREILSENKENTLFAQIGNINFLKKAMGKLFEIIMDPKTSTWNAGLAWAGLVPVALARLPGVIIKELLDPTQTIENIVAGVSSVYQHANSNLFKGIITLLSIVPVVILAPFAAVEQGLKQAARFFSGIGNWFSKNGPSTESAPQITSPLPSAKDKEEIVGESYMEMATRMSTLAASADKKVAQRVAEHLQELVSNKTAPEIINDYKEALDRNPDDIITLSDQDLQKVTLYLAEREKNADLMKKFQSCCDESLRRANRLSPKTPAEVDELMSEDENKHKLAGNM